MKYWSSVVEMPRALVQGIVNPRRGVIFPVPGLSPQSYYKGKRLVFERFGLEELIPVLSAEPRWRQAPQVTPLTGKLELTQQLYRRYAPSLYARIAKGVKPVIQTFNKDSRLGWPRFDRPVDKAAEVADEWKRYIDDPSSYAKCFTVMNVRVQPEALSKTREYQVPDDAGNVYDREMNQDERHLFGPYHAGRARLVFNKPMLNLTCQVVDTVINGWLGSQTLCHHDMYGRSWSGRVRPHVLAFDIKHMERFTAASTQTRYELIRGSYSQAHSMMEAQPYLTPSDTWRSFWLLANPVAGSLVQFGSGHSAVAPSQKEVLICLLTHAHVTLWGYPEDEAMTAVLSGESRELSMLNFGDDNFVSAYDPSILDALFEFLGRYLDVVRENPPKFLGFTWTGAEFLLGGRSYLEKTWLHERSPMGRFRTLPFLGWVLKRDIYSRHGNPSEMALIYDYENKVLEDLGLPWRDIETQARNEEREASGLVALSHPALLFGKDYLLTPEEKLASGQFVGWSADETAHKFNQLTKGGLLENALA